MPPARCLASGRGLTPSTISALASSLRCNFTFPLATLHLTPHRHQWLCTLGLRAARRDVLRAVPVESLDGDPHRALDPARVIRHRQLRRERWIIAGVGHPHAAKDFQPSLMSKVRKKQGYPVVRSHFPGCQILSVAAEIGVIQHLVVEDAQEAGRAAAELHGGPAGLRDGTVFLLNLGPVW